MELAVASLVSVYQHTIMASVMVKLVVVSRELDCLPTAFKFVDMIRVSR